MVNVLVAVPPAPSLTVMVTCNVLPVSPDTFERKLLPLMLNEVPSVPPVMENVSVWPVFTSVDDSVPTTPFSASGGAYSDVDSIGDVGATLPVSSSAPHSANGKEQKREQQHFTHHHQDICSNEVMTHLR